MGLEGEKLPPATPDASPEPSPCHRCKYQSRWQQGSNAGYRCYGLLDLHAHPPYRGARPASAPARAALQPAPASEGRHSPAAARQPFTGKPSPSTLTFGHHYLTHCRCNATNQEARLFPKNHCRVPSANRRALDKMLPADASAAFSYVMRCGRAREVGNPPLEDIIPAFN